jgi:DivIVA domain-containing protein
VFWLILVVIVLVVGAAALVALGGGGSLPEAERDRLAADLPLERQLDRADVDGLRFPMALRGYRMDEVDDVLDRLGVELAHRDGRITELEAALAAALDAPAGDRPTRVLLAPKTATRTEQAAPVEQTTEQATEQAADQAGSDETPEQP